MKNSIRDFISLSSAERKGIVVLAIIIALLTGVRAFLAFHTPALKYKEQEMLDSESGHFQQQFAGHDTSVYHRKHVESKRDSVVFKEFSFNPNCVNKEDMEQLGFESQQINNILRYRQKGGVFRKKDDLMKIYGMNDALYKRLVPYIKIPPQSGMRFQLKTKTVPDALARKITDINLADTASLMEVNGIGPVLSKRIVKYRTLLGGFYSINQLREVYGISDTLLVQLNKSFRADTSGIRKININTATEYELMRHPYIGKYTARGIVLYRKTVLHIKNTEELKTNGLLTEAHFEQLKKYLVN
jgi:competence protein ComEA